MHIFVVGRVSLIWETLSLLCARSRPDTVIQAKMRNGSTLPQLSLAGTKGILWYIFVPHTKYTLRSW